MSEVLRRLGSALLLLFLLLRSLRRRPHVFLLCGQSNLSGRGSLTDPVLHRPNSVASAASAAPLLLLGPDIGVVRFVAHQGGWELAPAREPLHRGVDIGKPVGVGPGLVFALTLRERWWRPPIVGLVPRAIGGSALREWQRSGGIHFFGLVEAAREATKTLGLKNSENSFFNKLINLVADGSDNFIGNGLIYRSLVKSGLIYEFGGEQEEEEGARLGMVWYQGETDAMDKVAAEGYESGLERFFADVRLEVGRREMVIVVVVVVGNREVLPHLDIVREATIRVARRDPNCVLVDPMALGEDLIFNEDRLHLSTQTQLKLGKLLANELERAQHERGKSYFDF